MKLFDIKNFCATAKPKRLTPKQDLFALRYAITGNALQSAKDAGYSETTALAKSSSWLENVGIKQAVDQHKADLIANGEQEQMTPEYIMKRAKELADQSDNPSAAVGALRLGADVHGMLSGGRSEMPPGLAEAMEALGRGLRSGRPELPEAEEAVEVESRIVEE